MTPEDKICVEIFYDACKFRMAGKPWLGDLDISNREEIQAYARKMKEDLLIELTPDELVKSAAVLKTAYKRGEELCFLSEEQARYLASKSNPSKATLEEDNDF